MTRNYPDLGDAFDWLKPGGTTNFCARFADVISRGNQWLRLQMSAVFSGQMKCRRYVETPNSLFGIHKQPRVQAKQLKQF